MYIYNIHVFSISFHSSCYYDVYYLISPSHCMGYDITINWQLCGKAIAHQTHSPTSKPLSKTFNFDSKRCPFIPLLLRLPSKMSWIAVRVSHISFGVHCGILRPGQELVTSKSTCCLNDLSTSEVLLYWLCSVIGRDPGPCEHVFVPKPSWLWEKRNRFQSNLILRTVE